MPTIHDSPTRGPPRRLRQKPSDVSTNHRSAHSNDSQTSLSSSSAPPSPTPASPKPSPRAIEISAAFERVRERSKALESTLSKGSEVTAGSCIKNFQDAAKSFFRELRHLPEDIPPTPTLISAIQGCSFEVHCFGSFADRFSSRYQGQEERLRELVAMLNEAMVLMCMLLELAAQVIEDAGVERNLLEESAEVDTNKAERDLGSGSEPLMGGRPLTWLVLAVNGPGSSPPELKRKLSSAGHTRKISSTHLKKPLVSPNGSTPPSTPNQPIFSRKEPLIPTKRPSKGKYDIRYLRKSVHLHRLEDDTPPLRDSLAMIGDSAPFPTDIPKPDPDELNAPYVEYNPDGSVKKANLRGLVGVITSGSAIEHEEFVSMVLTTFRLFASGQDLADALYFRYTEQQPEWLSRKGRAQFEWNMAQKRMKVRVATILHLWLELHWKPEDSGAIVRLQQLIMAMEKEYAFHAESLRTSLDQIIKEKDYYGRRLRGEERYRPTTVPPAPTSFAAKRDFADRATQNPLGLTILDFATTPGGIAEFTRMITMVESRYYHKLSPENFVHYKSEQTKKLRNELGEFEQRYKTWIVGTITTPNDPVDRANAIKFWLDVARECVQYRNFNTAYQIKCALEDPAFEKMPTTRQFLEQFDKGAGIHEFWKVCSLYENETWWSEINSSSLPAIPVSQILIRWRIYIEECGLRGVYEGTRDFSLNKFKSKGRINVDSFLNLADLIWDIERTYEPHTFVQVPWIENWFLAQVFAPTTDFGSETAYFNNGVAKDNPDPVAPDTVLAKLTAMLEAKLRRKEVNLIPLVPKKPSMEVIKKTSANKLKKRPTALALLNSNQSQPQPPSSRPGTPTSQNPDAQNQRQPNRLRKRSHSYTQPSPESIRRGLPIQAPVTPPPPAQAQVVVVKDRDRDRPSEAAFYRPTARINLGPPPSPSHGKRFEGTGVPGRRTPEHVVTRPWRPGPPSPPLGGARLPTRDWEII